MMPVRRPGRPLSSCPHLRSVKCHFASASHSHTDADMKAMETTTTGEPASIAAVTPTYGPSVALGLPATPPATSSHQPPPASSSWAPPPTPAVGNWDSAQQHPSHAIHPAYPDDGIDPTLLFAGFPPPSSSSSSSDLKIPWVPPPDLLPDDGMRDASVSIRADSETAAASSALAWPQQEADWWLHPPNSAHATDLNTPGDFPALLLADGTAWEEDTAEGGRAAEDVEHWRDSN